MESEKVKEIKKWLEDKITRPIDFTRPYENTLTLINELESENEELNNELKRYKMDWLNSEKMHLQADMEDTEFELFCANKSLEEVRAENKQLKDRIALLEKDNETLRNAKVVYENVDYCYEDLKKAEKKIAELEKEIEELAKWQRKAVHYYKMAKSYGVECIVDNDIDETLKEFIDD